MKIKIKYPSSDGIIRLENEVEIREVFIKEDMLNPSGERVHLGFVNKNSSGIIELSGDEFDRIDKSAKGRIHLVKDVKVFREYKKKRTKR